MNTKPLERNIELANNLLDLQARLTAASEKAGHSVNLVAVSKTKPISDILSLYSAGHRKFGENYFQELSEKACQLPNDIEWHFIGHLQSSKANKILKDVPNLSVLETVDSEKLASKLNAACVSQGRVLQVYVQVDTSGEDTKSGVDPSKLNELVVHIRNSCPQLKLAGLMTIGAPGDVSCFEKLRELRTSVASLLEVPERSLDLSMGMSNDFEEAIKHGSTSVRIGSTLFGSRMYPPK